jgi:hypothetical protein
MNYAPALGSAIEPLVSAGKQAVLRVTPQHAPYKPSCYAAFPETFPTQL